MEIPRNPNPIDPAERRRAAEAAKRSAERALAETPIPAVNDAVATPSSEAVERYVAMLKAHNRDPAKLEALRLALKNGTFTATPEELVDPLLNKLDEPGG
jgi:anti-sigma28 factor (negative regulator of flagellin synthesis)